MSALLLGCGGSSHTTAHTTAQTARCPAGKTLISGHFHFYGCVPSQEARVVFICNEAGYELAGILNRTLRDPQPASLQNLFEQGASESIATLKHTKLELVGSDENASSELLAVEGHRRELVAYLAEVRRTYSRHSFRHWYRSLLARDGACRRSRRSVMAPAS